MLGLHHSSSDESASGLTPDGRLGCARSDLGQPGLARTLLTVARDSMNPAPRPPTPGPTDGPPPHAEAGAGDYGGFFRATFAPLRRYLARLVGSHDEAQDIAQDAYARVYAVMRERPVEHPRALLYTTARHLAIDELKHRGRSPFAVASVDAALSPAPAIEAIVMAREEAALLAQAIERLPDECRAVLLLRLGEQLTHEEVGARLGLTKKQAEKRLHRAVRELHLAMHAPGPADQNPSHTFNP